jgi:hypothetical protein
VSGPCPTLPAADKFHKDDQFHLLS